MNIFTALFRTTPTVLSDITQIEDHTIIGGYRVSTTWSSAGMKKKGVTTPSWTIAIRPLDRYAPGQYRERTISGLGTVQDMNQIKDQMLTSMGITGVARNATPNLNDPGMAPDGDGVYIVDTIDAD